MSDIADQVERIWLDRQDAGRPGRQHRNDMYLVSEAMRLLMKDKPNDLGTAMSPRSTAYKASLDRRDEVHPDLGEGGGGASRSASAP